MSDRRSAVFLEEMGVGAQWRLRNRPVAAADAVVSDVAADGVASAAPQPLTPVTAAAPHIAAATQPTPAADRTAQPPPPAMPPQAPAHAAPPSAAAPSPAGASPHSAASLHPAAPPRAAAPSSHAATPSQVAAPAQAAAAPSSHAAGPSSAAGAPRMDLPQASAEASEAAAAPVAPAVPATPARAPGTPSIASTGEDMSWFDDAPTPEFKPQRKKVAAPEQPPAPQPARPAPAAASAQATPAPRSSMPSPDDIPMDEPPAWFDDDDQPATAAAPGAADTSDEGIATMDWPTLQAAVATCTRCTRCETRQQAIPGRGDEQATWIALDTAPGQAEDTEGYQFAGDSGHLLDNMLKAVGQTTEKGAYLTSLVKCHAPHAPSAEELQACRPYLERELQLTQAKVMIAFGHSTGKGLLGSAARGRIMLHGSVPVVATYHPADLLKKPEEKAKAWQDLCLAKAAHAGRR